MIAQKSVFFTVQIISVYEFLIKVVIYLFWTSPASICLYVSFQWVWFVTKFLAKDENNSTMFFR